MPAVPLKLKKSPSSKRTLCSMTKCPSRRADSARVRRLSSRFRWPHRAWTIPTRGSSKEATSRRRKHDSGTKSRVEDADELAARGAETEVERSRLEPRAIRPAQDLRVHARAAERADLAVDDPDRLVVRIVEHLDLEPVAGVVQRSRGADQARGDGALVVDGSWDRDPRQIPRGIGDPGSRTVQRNLKSSQTLCAP
jgi:hypothetical protein